MRWDTELLRESPGTHTVVEFIEDRLVFDLFGPLTALLSDPFLVADNTDT